MAHFAPFVILPPDGYFLNAESHLARQPQDFEVKSPLINGLLLKDRQGLALEQFESTLSILNTGEQQELYEFIS